MIFHYEMTLNITCSIYNQKCITGTGHQASIAPSHVTGPSLKWSFLAGPNCDRWINRQRQQHWLMYGVIWWSDHVTVFMIFTSWPLYPAAGCCSWPGRCPGASSSCWRGGRGLLPRRRPGSWPTPAGSCSRTGGCPPARPPHAWSSWTWLWRNCLQICRRCLTRPWHLIITHMSC